jgi:hypothetical protein
MGKVLLFINFKRVTYNSEIFHCSSNLVLGFASTMLQLPSHMLLFTKWLQNVGARGIHKRVEFLYYYFPLSNGTLTPSFIG